MLTITTENQSIRASANIGKFTNEQVDVPVSEYIDELEEAVSEAIKNHGQKVLKKTKKAGNKK